VLCLSRVLVIPHNSLLLLLLPDDDNNDNSVDKIITPKIVQELLLDDNKDLYS
jgi:hypothetical protein